MNLAPHRCSKLRPLRCILSSTLFTYSLLEYYLHRSPITDLLGNRSYFHCITSPSSYAAHILPWFTSGGHTVPKLRLSTPSTKKLRTPLQTYKMGGTFSRMFSALAWSKKEIRILILGLVCSVVTSGAFYADYSIG